MSKKVFVTNSFKETQELGEKFAKKLARSHLARGLQGETLVIETLVIALYGELGSGKTTFVQGLARGLGIKRRIISPTFIIVRRYVLKSQKLKFKIQKYNSKFKSFARFYHIDLYRVQTEKQVKDLGIEEIIEDPQNIVAIEWAEKLGDMLPKKRWDAKFEHVGGDKRRITIKKFSI